jgi:acetylornithine deacetylase/succinyl-diaminopimelate desuccinylase-like protein
VVANSRPGFFDACFYRHAGVPSVVYGVAANNMGGPDEFATVADSEAVYRVIAPAAFDYLCQRRAGA